MCENLLNFFYIVNDKLLKIIFGYKFYFNVRFWVKNKKVLKFFI